MKIKKNGEWIDFSLPVAIPTMTGASSSTNGTNGLVPAPAAGDQDKYLKADGTWGAMNVSNDGVRSIASGSSNGTISVNTNGTTADVAVTGLGSAAYTDSNAYAASDHNHSADNITSGTLPVSRGGTGLTAAPSMLTNLGSTSASSPLQASPRPGVTGTLPIANGGTGAATASAALSNLGGVPISEVANSANKIPRYNADGHLVLPDGSEFWIA